MRKKWLAIAAGILLGLIFIAAGLGKLAGPIEIFTIFSFFPSLKPALVKIIVLWLPCIELILGLLLVTGIALKIMASVAGVLIAVFILNTPFETVRKIIDFKKAYPDKSANEIYNEIKGEYGIIQRTIRFEKLIYDGLSEACMKKQMHYDDLIIKILIDWLKKGGYLGKTPLTAPDINETHAININKKTLLGGGYQFLKKIGNREVYQRATGKGSGFIKAYLFKRNQAYLKLTAGEYDDPKKILEDEINRLQFFEARNIKTKILRKPRKWLKRKIG